MKLGPLLIANKRGYWEFVIYGGYYRTVKGKSTYRRVAHYSMYKRKGETEKEAVERLLARKTGNNPTVDEIDQIRTAMLFHEVCS